MDEEKAESRLIDMLGICGCGVPGRVIDWVGNYLRLRSMERPGPTEHADWYKNTYVPSVVALFGSENSDSFWAAAYFSDLADLTEHGGSVAAAWLTDKGREFLELWEQGPS